MQVMSMRAELVIHLESADDGENVWWAETPSVDGFSAAAPTLPELRSQATRALREIISPDVEIVERLVGRAATRRSA